MTVAMAPGGTGPATRNRLTGAGLALAVPLLVLGLTLPVVSIDQFYVFRDEVSVLSGIASLATAGEWPLAVIVATFSIVFPIAKLAVAARLWWRGDGDARRLKLLATLGKWSMLDVFLVALLVIVVKLSLVATVRVETGIYIFAAAVLVSTVSVHSLARAAP